MPFDEATLPYDWEPIQAKLIRANGTDLDVVNAARRSFGKQSKWVEEFGNGQGVLSTRDCNLLEFLGRGFAAKDFEKFVEDVAASGWRLHEEIHSEDYDEEIYEDKLRDLVSLLWKWRDEPVHDTPFNHVGLHVAIMVPMFTARQLVKHEYMPWSEVSRRYIGQNQEPGEDQERLAFWKPGLSDGVRWRLAPENKKQGSGHPVPDEVQFAMNMTVESNVQECYNRFRWALDAGVCMEQARMHLPSNLMVEVTWSGFLGAFCKMLRERLGLGAQEEARVIARMLYDIAVDAFPRSVPALVRR